MQNGGIRPEPEAMDTTSPTKFSFGRGRGLHQFRGNTSKPQSRGPPSTQQSEPSVRPKTAQRPPSPKRPSSELSAEDEEANNKKKLQEAEARSGISANFFDNLFSIGPSTSQVVDQKPWATPNYNWYKNPEVKEEPQETKEKKFLGKQYVLEAQKKEQDRIKEIHKEEQSARAESPLQSSGGATAMRRSHDMSNISMQTSMSTNIDSVGTYQQIEQMEAIGEEEDNSDFLSRYWPQKNVKRTKLPINEYEDRILRAIDINRVLIIEGATGCGKTTQVPQYIADDCAMKGKPFNIIVTQPRRIAAKSVAMRVGQERGWPFPSLVGYQIGMDSSKEEGRNEDTRILYCTTGILLQRLIHQQKMDMYSHIVIDEVHERSTETDLLLLVIKKLMSSTGVSTKIILMSATFDVTELKNYFSFEVFDENDQLINRIPPEYIKVKERPHKLNKYFIDQIKKDLKITDMPARDIRFRADPEDETVATITPEMVDVFTHIMERGLDKVEEGKDGNKGSVLVFLPGLDEICEVKARLEQCKIEFRRFWNIIPLHSSLPLENQNKVFSKKLPDERRVILATNIAESSITVPDVTFVIDFCLTKNMVADPETHIPVLRTEWASKANCDQRAGRAGRVSEGRVYRLITNAFYNSLPEFNQPELVRSPLDLSILRVKVLNMGPPKDLLGLAITPPDLADIYHSVLQLKQVGAFSIMTTKHGNVHYDDEDGDLTTLGRIMASLPIDIRLSKLVCMGHVFDVLSDSIIIAAALSTQGMFRRDFNQGLSAYKSRLAWADRSFSDAIACMNAYKMYKKWDQDLGDDNRSKDNWCRQNFIQYRRVKDVDFMYGDILNRLRHENIDIPERPNQRRNRNAEELILKVVMCAAFYPNYFTRNPIEVENIAKMICNKDPKESVMINGFPPNQGILYTKSIRDMFTVCSKRIDIDFEDTKAYLTFLDDVHPLQATYDKHIPEKERVKLERSESKMSVKSEDRHSTMSDSTITSGTTNRTLVRKDLKETTIKTAVYVAVAMRNNREVQLSLPRLQDDVADKEMDKLSKVKTEAMQTKQTFHSHRLSVPYMMPQMKMSKLELPALDCYQVDIRITHVDNPALFYAQYNHYTTDKRLNDLSAIISYELDETNTRKCDHNNIRVGDVVIAELRDRQGALVHSRAIIEEIRCKPGTKEIDEVQIFFIDYGFNQIVYDVSHLTKLTAKAPIQLIDIPPQAFRCALSEVNPSPFVCHDGNWSKKSIEYFNKWVRHHNKITAKIYSVINRMVRVELFDSDKMNQSFNEELINYGFAEKWCETPQSRLNRSARQRALLSRDDSLGTLRLEKLDEKGVYNPDDIIELEVNLDSSDRSRNFLSHQVIKIRGPHSPLECHFTGMTRNTSYRTVSIEKSSVNCVVLEPDYLSKHCRLLVASCMGLGQNSNNINLRNTTLMPNIMGFPALMAVLFAPRVQLKASKERTHYIGAICGLGYYKNSVKGYDPDSDAEVIFDADISLEDMVKVNVIRSNISTLFKSRESLREYTEGSLAITQKRIRRNVFELLDRRRRLVDNSAHYPNFKWVDMKADDINTLMNKSQNDINKELLPLCEQMQIDFKFNWYDDIAKNLLQLNNLVKGEVSKVSECKLCRFKTYTKTDLCIHVNSNEHNEAIRDFEQSIKIAEQEKKKGEYQEDHDDDEEEYFDSDDDIEIME